MVKDKVWFVTMTTGYPSSKGYDILVVPADTTDDDVLDEAWEMALRNAERYGIYPASEYNDDLEEDEDAEGYGDNTSNNIDGYAVPYEPELHDKYKAGGGSFMDTRQYKEADL